MGYITEIGLTSRFFQGKGAYQLVYHKNSGTLPLMIKVFFLDGGKGEGLFFRLM